MNNPIIEELRAMTRLGFTGKQQAFHEKLVADAMPVQCVSVRDVFTAEEIRIIKRVLCPKKRQCYRNAALLTELFPDRAIYVEGFGWNGIAKVNHAFNRVGDKYIDITWEMALNEDVTPMPYVSLIEATRDEILADIQAHGNTTGDYYLHKYIEGLGGKQALARSLDEQAAKTLEKGGAISEVTKKAGTL